MTIDNIKDFLKENRIDFKIERDEFLNRIYISYKKDIINPNFVILTSKVYGLVSRTYFYDFDGGFYCEKLTFILNMMQPINRNELLDKIAQNWTLRRKNWGEGFVAIGKEALSEDLLADDWEGCPPIPKLKRKRTNVTLAEALFLAEENSGKYYIRRYTWAEDKFLVWKGKKPEHFDLSSNKFTNIKVTFYQEDFANSDWEIWTE